MNLKKFMWATMMLLCAFSFTSCGDDEDDYEIDEDELNQFLAYYDAIGDYQVTTEYYVSTDNTLSEDEMVYSEEDVVGISAGKDDKTLLFDEDFELKNFVAATNGFAFDLDVQTVDGITFTPLKIAELNGKKYHGLYLNETNTIEMYYSVPLQDAFDDETTDEILENLIEAYIAAGLLGDEETIESLDDLCGYLDDAKIYIRIYGKQK